MSGIAGNVKLEAARTAYQALGQQVFSGDRQGLWMEFSRVLPCDAEYFEVDSMGAVPAVQEIVGSRRWAAMRGYNNRSAVKRYGPDGYNIPILRILKDNTGIIEQELADYVRAAPAFWDKPLNEFLFNNPQCIDGTSLISTTHPYAFGGGNWSNKSTNALSPAEFFAAIAAMEALRLENGEPAGYFPRVLMVGPTNRKMALDLVSADRIVPIAATGLETYGSGVVAAATRSNFLSNGDTPIRVIVNTRMTGTWDDYWYLIDTQLEAARPIIFGEAIAPATYSVIEPSAPQMIDKSQAQFYCEGQGAPLGGVPFSIFGGIVS